MRLGFAKVTVASLISCGLWWQWRLLVKVSSTSRPAVNAAVVNEYPYLFHKFKSNLSAASEPISYKVVKHGRPRRVVAHLHCLKLWEFREVYGPFLALLQTHASVVVTYSHANDTVFKLRREDAVLRIPNKGMDIGAKFCAVHYLWNSRAKIVLFLHSKSERRERLRFFEWVLNQLPYVASLDASVGGVFSPYLVLEQRGWPSNARYVGDLTKLLELERDYFWFPVGNCFFLTLDMAKFLYGDRRLYNALNAPGSLDWGWFLEYYKPGKHNADELRTMVRRSQVEINNLRLGHHGLADSMVEHAFERVVFLALRKFGKIGVFDLAKVTSPAIDLSLPSNNGVVAYPRGLRVPIDDAHLVDRYFTNKTSRFARVAIIASSVPRATHNNLFYLAQVAARVVVVETAPDFGSYLDASPHRESFVVDSNLTDLQCAWYAAAHFDVRHLPIDEIRSNYRGYGKKRQRLIPNVLADVDFVSTADNKWHVALRLLRGTRYDDYILANNDVMFCDSIVDFVVNFASGHRLAVFADTKPDCLRRYSRFGARQLLRWYDTTPLHRREQAPLSDDRQVYDREQDECTPFPTLPQFAREHLGNSRCSGECQDGKAK